MKKIDVSVFAGQNFDCEFLDRFDRWNNVFTLDHVFQSDSFTGYYINKEIHWKQCRPRLNHWHFNDGSMVLPDGLVVEIKRRDDVHHGSSEFQSEIGLTYTNHETDEDWVKTGFGEYMLNHFGSSDDVIAVKILGVTAEYEVDGKRLGMQVVEP